jgi:hypothetical protein
MPAFCVSPKMSPLGLSRSISAVSDRLPRGPGAALVTSSTPGLDSTISAKPRFARTAPFIAPHPTSP